jgi:hypothetical protein
MQRTYTNDERIRLLEREIRRIQRLVADPIQRAKLIVEMMSLIIQVRNLDRRKAPTEEPEEKEPTFEEKMARIKRGE